MKATGRDLDVIIIGGGFYGCMLALYFRQYLNRVLLIEKEEDLLLRASYNNQARIHNGYHYPRSFITALRSHINYEKFILDFKGAIDDNYLMTYAIATHRSKVGARQFRKFCEQIGSALYEAPAKIKTLFNKTLVEDVFLVEEFVFGCGKLRKILKDKLTKANVKVFYGTEVVKVAKNKRNRISVTLGNGTGFESVYAINCAYSQINIILANSGLSLLPFKYEMTEMPLVVMPNHFKKFGVTIMDGPFFSIMPFPDKSLHTIHHVRYTPHFSWVDTKKAKQVQIPSQTHFLYMLKDVLRFIPSLLEIKYVDSLYEVKTVLLQNEITDRRPILFKKDYGIKNFHVVMGGKIDNAYDVIEEIKDQKSQGQF